jgi:NADH-quinone oxidoreductase subunit I
MGLLGKGLVEGLVVTARNFFGSYYRPERLTTVQYPEERIPLPENSRTFPFLVYDKEGDPVGSIRCTACKICEAECPPQCIYIVMDRDEKGKPKQRPRIFDIDISVCMQCQICVEVCPFEAIKMDVDFEKARYDRFDDLMEHLDNLLKPNSYYHKIHPTEATTVDARLEEERKKKAAKKAAAAAPAAKPAAAAPIPSKPGPASATPAPTPTSAPSTGMALPPQTPPKPGQ